MTNRNKVLPFATTRRFSNIAAISNIRKRKKEPHIVREILKDYCSNSTLHGINYMGAKDNRPAEKIWWMIMFVLSLATCAFLISRTWTKWNENPVLISFDTELTPISQIPFPAVTVCPLNRIVRSKYNYTEKYNNMDNLSDEDYKLFADLSLVCDMRIPESKINITDESAIHSIRKMAAKDIVIYVLWKNWIQDPTTYFTEQLTEDGLCFSFNTLSQNDMFTDQINKNTNYIDHEYINDGWNIEDGYLPELNMNAYPRRTVQDGHIYGLSFNIQTHKEDINYVCGSGSSGFKVTLHNPAETPKVAEQYFLIPFKKQVTIIVRPEQIKTDENLRSVPPETRKCYFSNEKSLRFFKIYTQNNCRVECNANISQSYCGCVPFNMPRDDETIICGLRKNVCLLEVESALRDFEVQEKLTRSDVDEENREKLEKTRDIFKNCHCLPSCSSLQYTAELSLTESNLDDKLLDLEKDDNSSQEFIKSLKESKIFTSQVNIFFKESQFLSLQRSELYGKTDFLANCGGLLGLFMGFSLLSLLEIIYFFTIRLWFKYQIRRTM